MRGEGRGVGEGTRIGQKSSRPCHSRYCVRFESSIGWIYEVVNFCMLVRCSTECHNQRYRTEAAVLLHGRKGSKQRPASLDLSSPGFHGATFSPSFVVGGVGLMKASHIRSDVFHSPGTLNYPRHCASVLGFQKGWCSERVPHPSKGSRRYPGSSMAFPYSNGRTLPSKWEDAERWIFSPNSSDALGRSTVAHARRPKSKSGPLGPPGRLGGQYSSVSSVSLLDSGRAGPITSNSPFMAGVLMPEHVCGGKNANGTYLGRPAGDETAIGSSVRFCPPNGGSHAVRSSRVRRRVDAAVESCASLPSTQESIQGIYKLFPVHRLHMHHCLITFSLLFSVKIWVVT